ncbi:HAD family hydrolase [Rothia sp. P5766]|uniref:HAD family hydrolase n=1 Tax=unclassified Rothia (in: high G+C Gram-positive bacteria) TaxID=2689056 RepID=UPI003AEE5D96
MSLKSSLLRRARLLLVDIEGTLLDSETATSLGFYRALQRYGFRGDFAESQALYRVWSDIQREDFQLYLAGEQAFDQHYYQRIASMLNLMTGTAHSQERAEGFLGCFEAHRRQAWVAFDDVEGFMRGLDLYSSHLQVVAVTNGSQALEQAKLDTLGLSDLPLLTSQLLGTSKPKEDFFRLICAALETDPAFAVHVGNNFLADVQAPVGAGLGAVWVNRSRRHQQIPPGIERVRALTELIDHY